MPCYMLARIIHFKCRSTRFSRYIGISTPVDPEEHTALDCGGILNSVVGEGSLRPFPTLSLPRASRKRPIKTALGHGI